MDIDIRDIESRSFQKKDVQKLFDRLNSIVEEAAEIRDREAVNDPELRHALHIVENFIKSRKRICYGGMAINAHLPAHKKFYDFSKTLPDYDFFTPNPDQDVEDLVKVLKASKFDSVSARQGMHEGTMKVFVNFHAVADITKIPYWLYKRLLDRAKFEKGLPFVDADYLRMNMYLELSRPRGEVERWDKVYKRLLLLNESVPPSFENCKKGKVTPVPKPIRQQILQFGAEYNCIFAGADLEDIYAHPGSENPGKFVVGSKSPILYYSESFIENAKRLHSHLTRLFPGESFSLVRWDEQGDLIPSMVGISRNRKPIVIFVSQNYCHSYNKIELENGNHLLIASPETAITLFYYLSFVRGMEGIVPQSAHCFANRLVKISHKSRDQGRLGHFPFLSITCSGHQPTKETLLREKAERIAEERKKKKGGRFTRRRLSDYN